LRIFLTGATGYIGRALALRLRAEGHELRALVRPASRAEDLAALGVALFPGDLAERASMREAMSGADWVIHAAAELDLEAPAGRMESANVAGSENVASLSHKLGVPRFLSISSIARWGGSPDDGRPATEETPQRLPLPTRYSRTKAAGEEAIQAWAKRGLQVSTVYPSLVYGPPGKKQGSNALLRQLWLGRFPVMLGGDRITSWVFLDDLVEGLVRVLGRSRPGRGYLMAGDLTTTREMAARVAALGGAPAPRRELPLGLARWLLRLAQPYYRARGRRAPIPIEQLASLERHWAFDDARARSELDWHPRSLAEGLPVTLDHLRSAR
jgi:nucleoside-diphosphate-sugar epimerase